ncbi:MAG TPA: hypothetical protein VGD84_20955, partial [Pseudonocardiaceae bacterium]
RMVVATEGLRTTPDGGRPRHGSRAPAGIEGVHEVRFGGRNDEAIHDHPLCGTASGLTPRLDSRPGVQMGQQSMHRKRPRTHGAPDGGSATK